MGWHCTAFDLYSITKQIFISPFIPSSFSQQHTYLQFQQEQKIIDTIKRGYTCVWEAWGYRIEELGDVNQLECVFNNAYCLSHLCKRCSGGGGGHFSMHSYEEFGIIFVSPIASKFLPILNLLLFVTKKILQALMIWSGFANNKENLLQYKGKWALKMNNYSLLQNKDMQVVFPQWMNEKKKLNCSFKRVSKKT